MCRGTRKSIHVVGIIYQTAHIQFHSSVSPKYFNQSEIETRLVIVCLTPKGTSSLLSEKLNGYTIAWLGSFMIGFSRLHYWSLEPHRFTVWSFTLSFSTESETKSVVLIFLFPLAAVAIALSLPSKIFFWYYRLLLLLRTDAESSKRR